MYYLILDTSSPRGIVALYDKESLLLSKEVSFGIRESNELVPVIEMCLNQLKISMDQITEIILSKGPGSFTGLRIGASVAKALAFAKNIPIVTLNSLKCFDPGFEGPFAVLLDAKVKGVYLQRGLKENGQIYYEDKVSILKLHELEKALSTIPKLITSNLSSFESKLSFGSFKKLIEMAPSPSQMYLMAQKKSKKVALSSSDILELEYFNTP